MNGDLSLSQSLGGLRIANADPATDDTGSPVAQSPQSSPGRAPLAHRSTHTSTTSYEPDHINVSSLGFDPSAYSYPQPPPVSTASAVSTAAAAQASAEYYGQQQQQQSEQQRRLAHRASASLRQPPYEPQPSSRNSRPAHERPYYPVLTRPSSSIYDQPSPIAREPSYTSAAAETAFDRQSQMTGGVRRSDSRTAAAAAMAAGRAAAARTPSGRAPPPVTSPSVVTAVSPISAPRRASRTASNQEPSYDPPSRSSTQPMGSYPGDTTPLSATITSSSEEWKEKGASVIVQKTTDKQGRSSTRVVKKGVKDFQFGRTLGEGSYSTVLAATDRSTGREYAIKVLDKSHIIKEKKVKYVNIEKDTLNRLTEHPGIVRLYYTFQDERSLYFVLDLATGGELLGVLKKTGSFDEECSRFYGAQILDSIEYMHGRGIIHRDLKPENVLLDDHMHVKITDFGTAKILELPTQQSFGSVSVTNEPKTEPTNDRAVSFVGTAEYVSPELLTDKNACKASDLWAFGCIIYQLLAGRPPFKAGNEYQTFQKIVHLDYSFPEGFPNLARDLVKKLLVLDPADRISIGAIKAHPFFEGIEWGSGLWKQKPPKLRPYKPYQRSAAAAASAAARSQHEPVAGKQISKLGQPSTSSLDTTATSTRPRMISALAPPSQLDIDWAPVLNKPNERVLKLGNLVVYSMPTPFGNTSGESQNEGGNKFSRFFGASATKKRQRLVMISSAARLIIAPSGGDKKEAKVVIELTEKDVAWRTQQDSKGYTVWCVNTRDRHYTFEDSKANTGDSGSSTRSTKEWTDFIEAAIEHVRSQEAGSPYGDDARYSDLTSPSNPSAMDSDPNLVSDAAGPHSHRNILRKDPDNDTIGRKRFSKRHSKNGLAAVF